MSDFEPSQILENSKSNISKDSAQQYVEIRSNTYLGTKDGIKYTLLPTDDNKFKLCEVSSESDTNMNVSTSWLDPYKENSENANLITPTSNHYKAIKFVSVKKEPTPCRGQGDESGNSIISTTPDSTSRFKGLDNSFSEKTPDLLEEDQFKLGEHSQLTYTTLLPRQEHKYDTLDTTNFFVPGTFFQFPSPIRTPLTAKPTRLFKSRQRLQLNSTSPNPYPQCSPIPYQRGRGVRQRKPRQVIYQYRGPIMHSTPTSTSGSSLSDNLPLSSVDTPSNSSINTSDDSLTSLDYPRVPNNTPNSGEDVSDIKEKVLGLDWIHQMQTSIDNFAQMDPRETHNEKERKRRLRIKNSCQFIKSQLPNLSNKTDNATVFENAVHFIAFMRETLGTAYDEEFLEQTCIY